MSDNRLDSNFMTFLRHYVCVFIIGGAALVSGGCASSSSKHVIAPSTVGSNRAIAGARQSNQNAQKFNDLSRTDAERIEAKAAVVRKYWGK